MTKGVGLLVLLLVLFTAMLPRSGAQTPPPPEPSKAPHFNGTNLPVPPMQNAPWRTPSTVLPENYLSAALALFDAGLPDPRNCHYREIVVGVGSLPVWPPPDRTSTNGVVSTRGWVLTSDGPNRFAICWNGLIYSVLELGAQADLRSEVANMLTSGTVHWGVIPEAKSVSPLSLSGIQGCLLLRLGEAESAGRVWGKHFRETQSRLVPHLRSTNVVGEFGLPERDPYLDWATEWTWALFDRATFAHIRGDDGLALATTRTLAVIQTTLEVVGDKRGLKRPPIYAYNTRTRNHEESPGPFFEFLKPVPELLADHERRLLKSKRPKVVESPAESNTNRLERIAALIEDLDDARGLYYTGSSSTWYGDKTVQALLNEGAEAVEPLLNYLEQDNKSLARAFYFDGDGLRGRLGRGRASRYVQEIAMAILFANFQTTSVDSWATTSEMASAGTNQNRIAAAKMRAYWRTFNDVPLEERWYQALADDNASQDAWRDALANILLPVTSPSPLPNYPRVSSALFSNSLPPFRGEPLRARTNPTVTELLLKRASALDLLAISKWDPQAALPLLRSEMQRHLTLWANASQFEPWSLEYNRRGGYGCTDAANSIIALTVERARSADMHALTEYAAWSCSLTLPHYRVWLDRSYGRRELCEPIWEFPTHPAVTNAAAFLFSSPKSPLAAELSLTNGTKSFAIERCTTRLMELAAFRALILSALREQTDAGTAHLGTNEWLSIRTRFHNDGRMIGNNHDTGRAVVGEDVTFRLCDYLAKQLSAWAGMPRVELYWQKRFRDEAVEECIRQVQTRGNDFAKSAVKL